MNIYEKAIAYTCEGEIVTGILHQPENPLSTGVVLVVGGPQYRVGSHRQFVVLARFLAEQGVSVLRFDYRGMGDSSGVMQDFEQAQPDIKAAVNIFFEHNASVKKVVLWGLCDAASAIGFYAAGDDSVKGLVLLNPWVRTEQGESKAYLKEYYLKRLVSRAFWQKILSGDVQFKASLASLYQKLMAVFKKVPQGDIETALPLPNRVLEGFASFQKDILFIFSGKDLTAKEFTQLVDSDAIGKALMQRRNVKKVNLHECDHTFSRKKWRSQVNESTLDWIKSL